MALDSCHSTMVDTAGHLSHVDTPHALLRHRNESATSLDAKLVGKVAAPHDHLSLPLWCRVGSLFHIHGRLIHGGASREGSPRIALTASPKRPAQR